MIENFALQEMLADQYQVELSADAALRRRLTGDAPARPRSGDLFRAVVAVAARIPTRLRRLLAAGPGLPGTNPARG